MGKRSSRQQVVYLPVVLCATFLVTVCPVILVWWLRDSGVVTSMWVGIGIGTAVSFGASYVGAALWKKRTGSQDILFSELMLWGWVQRWRAEGRLATATDVLGLRHGPRHNVSGGRLTHEQKAGLLTQLASALEARDLYTHGHSRRVARHASNIAKRMGLPAAEVTKIRTAGVMHDVGKVKVPTAVLHKEAKLTDGEFKVIQRHPVEGARMVSTLGDDELTAMVRHHHERFDGTGYPEGLAGDAIPLGARILAVADTFDAITSARPYREAHAHKKAIDILTAEAGVQLDPDAVRAFCSCYTGSRPLVVWTVLANGPPRFAGWVGGGLSTAKASSVASVMATAAATTAVGGAALGPLVEAPQHSHRAAKAATAPDAAPAARQRPVPIPAAGAAADDGRASPVKARGRGAIAPDARQSQGGGRRANATSAPAQGEGHSPVATLPASGVPSPVEEPNQAPEAPAGPDKGPNKPKSPPGQNKRRSKAPKSPPGQIKGPNKAPKSPPVQRDWRNKAPKSATGQRDWRNKAPKSAPGHGKNHGGHMPDNGKRPGPERPTTRRDAKPSPAGGGGPAGDPKRPSPPAGKESFRQAEGW